MTSVKRMRVADTKQALPDQYIAAVDIGGTFTDGMIIDRHGSVTLAKAFSTPPDFSRGVLNVLAEAASSMGIDLRGLLEEMRLFLHSTTVAENALVDGTLAKAGIITTHGFRHTLFATRGGFGRWSGLTDDEKRNPIETDKPPPLVPIRRIQTLRERIDKGGRVLSAADKKEIEKAVRELKAQGIESLGICLLWSFVNPEHEDLVRRIAEEVYPDLYVTTSSSIAPMIGEYERTSTVALNASLGPVARSYLENLEDSLRSEGFRGQTLVMQAYGGLLPLDEAIGQPVGMLESGPVSGVMGSQALGQRIGQENIISADMGGTTFKVGTVRHGLIEYQQESMVLRYHYVLPKRDIVSLGVAGGSIIWIDERTGSPHVGPKGAGSYPGPVCYDHGGEEPTLTDVDSILGYLNPAFFVGGRESLALDKARRVFADKVASVLKMEVEEAASAVYRLANGAIYDLLHRTTIQRGLDTRKFALFSTGGTAGMHLPAVSKELMVSGVVIPYTASVHAAYGLASSDVVHEELRTRPMRDPFDADRINEIFRELTDRTRGQLASEGFSPDEILIMRAVDMRYRRQVHIVNVPIEITVPVDEPGTLNDDDVEAVVTRFEDLYLERYGPDSTFREAGMEMVRFRVRASGTVWKPKVAEEALTGEDPTGGLVERRRAWVPSEQRMGEMPGYDWERLHPGNRIEGPAIIWTPITTIVVDANQTARIDGYRNTVITSN